MKIAFHTTTVSPHQLPFARELVARVGRANYRYVYTRELAAERRTLGWQQTGAEEVELLADGSAEARQWLEEADVLITAFREVDLIARRCAKGLKTFYTNERWFKPAVCGEAPFGWCDCACVRRLLALGGYARYYVPGFRRVTRRLVALARREPNFRLLPIGVHALVDYAWAGVPRDKMDVWGYFVDSSKGRLENTPNRESEKSEKSKHAPLRVLWVGRFLNWKRVRDLARACAQARADGVAIELTVKTGIPLDDVRQLMRSHDLYVLPSGAYEGWGAVVSEALEEGMNVVGTYEAGATATLLPQDHLYPAGDVKALAARLVKAAHGELDLDAETRQAFHAHWTAAGAAARFWEILRRVE